jgi:hypothetical protein
MKLQGGSLLFTLRGKRCTPQNQKGPAYRIEKQDNEEHCGRGQLENMAEVVRLKSHHEGRKNGISY